MLIKYFLGNRFTSNFPTKNVAAIPIIVAVALTIANQLTFCPNSYSMKIPNNPTYNEFVVCVNRTNSRTTNMGFNIG